MNKILIAVGGTGGHVFPAIGLAEQLKKIDASIEVLFTGGRLETNKFFNRTAFPYHPVSCGSLQMHRPLAAIGNVGRIGLGTWQSRKLLRDFQPDLVVGFGSFYTFPTLLASLWEKTPILLHESNSIPGKVNRLLSKYADCIGIQFPEAALHLKGNSRLVKTPLREGFRLGSVTRQEASRFYGLSPTLPTLLVFGGSQGAKAINALFSEAPFKGQLQILHFTGDASATPLLKEKYQRQGIPAVVKDFEPRMDMAWQAADCVISRSGAGTIAEQLEFEVPGILIPFPFATENHQEKNADYMVDQIGGASKLLEKDLTSARLGQEIERMLDGKYLAMRESIRYYKGKTGIIELSALVLDTLLLHKLPLSQ